jgi:RNA polymerase sigma-70 factor (sigma-E family)
MTSSPPDEYEQFVRARTPALLRSAYLLTGDQQLAEDLVQEALARTHRAWRQLDATGNAEAYARKVMYHTQVSFWRRRRVAEFLPGTMPDVPGGSDPADHTAVRLAVQRALAALSPRQRAVIVLRYFEDRTEVETAESLGGISGGCADSRVTFNADRRWIAADPNIQVSIAAAAPVTIGGAHAYAVTLLCNGPAEGGVAQVVAYRRPLTGNASDLLGVVVATTGDIDEIDYATDLGTPDLIQAQLAHHTVDGSAPPEYSVIHQIRFYRYQAGKFVQEDGPATFAVDPSLKATVTTSALVFGKAVNGCRTGTMTLTVRNTGAQALGPLSAAVIYPDMNEPVNCTVSSAQGYESALVPVIHDPPVKNVSFAPGATATTPVTFVIPDQPGLSDTTVYQAYNFVQLRVEGAFGQLQYFEDKVPFVVSFE